jgi:hypothetical protein
VAAGVAESVLVAGEVAGVDVGPAGVGLVVRVGDGVAVSGPWLGVAVALDVDAGGPAVGRPSSRQPINSRPSRKKSRLHLINMGEQAGKDCAFSRSRAMDIPT